MDHLQCYDNMCHCKIDRRFWCIIGFHVSKRACGSHFRYHKKGHEDRDHHNGSLCQTKQVISL